MFHIVRRVVVDLELLAEIRGKSHEKFNLKFEKFTLHAVYVFMHDRVCLGKVLSMLGLSHRSVDLGMDSRQYGI